MGLVYLPTWMVDLCGFHVGKYTIHGWYGYVIFFLDGYKTQGLKMLRKCSARILQSKLLGLFLVVGQQKFNDLMWRIFFGDPVILSEYGLGCPITSWACRLRSSRSNVSPLSILRFRDWIPYGLLVSSDILGMFPAMKTHAFWKPRFYRQRNP